MKNPPVRRYSIRNLSEKQLVIIRNALELCSRLGMGQTDDVPYFLPKEYRKHPSSIEDVVDLLRSVSKTVTQDIGGGYYGITNDEVSTDAKISWDMYQAIRNKIAWTNEPGGGIFVCFDKPMPVSDEPLPLVEVDSELLPCQFLSGGNREEDET